MSKEIKTFADFKKDFYEKIKDFTIFDCAEFNTLKVVLDGLVVNYASKGRIRTPMFYFQPLYSIFLFLKRFKNKKTPNLKNPTHKVLFYDVARAVKSETGAWVHFRSENIIKHYGSDKCTLVIDKPDRRLSYNYDFIALRQSLSFLPLSKEDRTLRKDLIKTKNKIAHSNIFTPHELKNIEIAFQLFFDQFRTFNYLLKANNYEVAHFDGHYHREGLLLALKRNKTFAHELQHGLIAPEDIFYVFPKEIKKIASKALFPDKISVFGTYWKNILLKGSEFNESQINIIGNYQYKSHLSEDDTKHLLDIKKNNILILISTQTYLHKYFIDYIKFIHQIIVEQTLSYKILLKIHPNENPDLYVELKDLDHVHFINHPIENLFEFCSIQISIYSTTLYEALAYQIKNYSLSVEICKDYVARLLEQGVSKALELNETPFFINNELEDVNFLDFYSPFNPQALIKE